MMYGLFGSKGVKMRRKILMKKRIGIFIRYIVWLIKGEEMDFDEVRKNNIFLFGSQNKFLFQMKEQKMMNFNGAKGTQEILIRHYVCWEEGMRMI